MNEYNTHTHTHTHTHGCTQSSSQLSQPLLARHPFNGRNPWFSPAFFFRGGLYNLIIISLDLQSADCTGLITSPCIRIHFRAQIFLQV
uniref:Uncharacterized protein n=1 Tax=Denticeps clupeoides TaxID=299321 RepID=A0AAY4AP96_9TELE